MSKIKKYGKFTLEVLKFCIGNDETRPQLIGVNHNSSLKKAVSTNGYVMAAVRGYYDGVLADQTIGTDFKTIGREFPKVDAIIPTNFDQSIKVTIEKQHVVKSKKPVFIYIYADGTLSFDKKDGQSIAINSEFLKPLIGQSVTMHCNFKNDLQPIKIMLHDDTDDFMLIMPLRK